MFIIIFSEIRAAPHGSSMFVDNVGLCVKGADIVDRPTLLPLFWLMSTVGRPCRPTMTCRVARRYRCEELCIEIVSSKDPIRRSFEAHSVRLLVRQVRAQ